MKFLEKFDPMIEHESRTHEELMIKNCGEKEKTQRVKTKKIRD